ncbi:unnamed protein product [Lupinus luteus]|uniref:Uncharacterized protein n=1 Tax=Lupinus luteus TaxID=3873 RepID=A0AAV1Y810_LUPLU
MSSDSVSNTETLSITQHVSHEPEPQPSSMILSANAESLSSILSQPLNNPSPNHRTLHDYVLSVGPGGFRLVDSGLNPVPSFGSLSLDPNPTQVMFSHDLGSSKVDDVLTEKPVELVEGSEKKEKTKVTFQLQEGNKGSVSGSGVSAEGEAIELCGEESNLNTKEEEGEGKKTWNLRPRKEKKVAKSGTTNGSGGRRSVVQDSSQTKMPTRPRTPRAATSSQGSGPSVFSLTLTKSEIEEDFLKMTGQPPPKKPQRRSKNVQKHMDGIFPGMFLDKVTPQAYKSS